MDAWAVFTGDGYRLADYVAKRHKEVSSGRPEIFVIGPDNLLLAERGKETTAAHLGWRIKESGVSSNLIVVDDTPAGSATHGQARVLIEYARRNRWRRIALFCSGHHILRSWLTVVGQLVKQDAQDLFLALPEPAYGLSFLQQNDELAGSNTTAWHFFADEGVPRITRYQRDKEPPDVATWESAVAYLRLHNFRGF
ncbi:MAG: hypothetical protein M1153_00025 [Patescibacteria group bacterium]|nr:hypothetical protein [Patescibacteria group bacterium]